MIKYKCTIENINFACDSCGKFISKQTTGDADGASQRVTTEGYREQHVRIIFGNITATLKLKNITGSYRQGDRQRTRSPLRLVFLTIAAGGLALALTLDLTLALTVSSYPYIPVPFTPPLTPSTG